MNKSKIKCLFVNDEQYAALIELTKAFAVVHQKNDTILRLAMTISAPVSAEEAKDFLIDDSNGNDGNETPGF